jgi:josephin
MSNTDAQMVGAQGGPAAVFHVGFAGSCYSNTIVNPTLERLPMFALLQERQHLQHCMKHMLNNLLQRPAFSTSDMNRLADALSPRHLAVLPRHRTLLLGNYDVNVLEAALAEVGRTLHWHDRRDTEYQRLDFDIVWALIINVSSKGLFGLGLIPGRHWYGIRKIDEVWYVLDSGLQQPQRIHDLVAADVTGRSSEDLLRLHLQQEAANRDAQVFYVT